MPDTPLNPDALAQVKAAAVDCRINGGSTEDVAECAVEAYLAVAQPVVNSVEELDELPNGTLVRSGGREFYRTSYIENPWVLPYGVDRFGSSYLAKHSKVVLVHRPEVES